MNSLWLLPWGQKIWVKNQTSQLTNPCEFRPSFTVNDTQKTEMWNYNFSVLESVITGTSLGWHLFIVHLKRPMKAAPRISSPGNQACSPLSYLATYLQVGVFSSEVESFVVSARSSITAFFIVLMVKYHVPARTWCMALGKLFQITFFTRRMKHDIYTHPKYRDFKISVCSVVFPCLNLHLFVSYSFCVPFHLFFMS